MTPDELTRTLQHLRDQDNNLIKTAGKLTSTAADAVKNVWTASTKGAATAGKHLTESGFHPVVGGAVKYAPHVAALYGAKKTYESDPVQRSIFKYKLWKARRAQRKAMRGYQ